MITGKTMTSLRGILAGTLLLGSAAFAPAAFAQDDDDRFGTWLYSGTVDGIETAEAIEEIGELERDDDDDTARIWEIIGNGQQMPEELYTEDEDEDDDLTLDDLMEQPHLVVVHEEDDTDSPIVALGVIEGETDEDGGVLIQLIEYEGSGFEGRAWIGPERDDDDDDDDLDLVIGVYPAGAVEPLGTPETTPRG